MKVYLSLILFAAIATFSCKPAVNEVKKEDSTAIKTAIMMNDISVEEAAEKISEGEAVFIDVRTDEEVANGMIPGSVHLDINSPNFETEISKLDKDKEYVVYCRSGGRSARACKKMQELGFKNLNNMLGGFNKWDNK
jgi:rhodanese-related sulfurtransferase